jgi:hypothetical protein
MADWKNPKAPAQGGTPAPGPGATPAAAKAAPGAPGSPAPAGTAAKGAQGAPGPAGTAPAKKPGFLDRIRGKANTKQEQGRGRPPKEEKKPEKKDPLTPEQIQDGAKVAADLEVDLFSTVLGDTFLSGKYDQDDRKNLTKSHAAWIEHFQVLMPWWITFWMGQVNYIRPRVRDEKNRDAIRSFFGFAKKPKEIEVKRVDEPPKEAASGGQRSN